MDIHYREADVVSLRSKICQDFFALVAGPSWKEELWKYVSKQVNSNSKHKDKYLNIYEIMVEKGMENFGVGDMDVTFISMIVIYTPFVSVHKKVEDAMRRVSDDRNGKQHSGDNESEDVRYRRCLIHLEDLRKFIIAVQCHEHSIEQSARQTFTDRYKDQIASLIGIIDTERMEKKDIEKKIDRILSNENPNTAWSTINHNCFNNWWAEERERYISFCIMASDRGIAQAHLVAAEFRFMQRDVNEVIKRISMFLLSGKIIHPNEVLQILDLLNRSMRYDKTCESVCANMVKTISDRGYMIKQTTEGNYFWDRKK